MDWQLGAVHSFLFPIDKQDLVNKIFPSRQEEQGFLAFSCNRSALLGYL